MKLPVDFADLLGEFARFEVEYMLVGGYAVSFHTRPRSTKDLDLWVRGTPANLERLARALEAFGAPPGIVLAARKLAPSEILFFGLPPLRIDVLRSVDGIDFDEAYAERVQARFDDIDVTLIGAEHLLRNKLATGRAQDLLDADALREKARGSS